MTKRIAQLIQLLLMVSLLAAPSPVFSCPVVPPAQAEMSCCGNSCNCPTGKICTAVPCPTVERSLSQVQPEILQRVPVVLYALNFKQEPLSSKSIASALRNAKPPPLIAGSPPQAKLRVWIL